MKLVTDRSQRNYNYLEIIAAYNSLIEQEKEALSKAEFKSFERALGSELIGISSVEEIIDSLVSRDDIENTTLDLFEIDGEDYFICKENKILPVASREEALIVYSMLVNGDFDLFLDNDVKDKLLTNITRFFENLGETPENLYDYIEDKGKSLCYDDLNEIKDYYNILKKAKENGEYVKLSYFYNDETREHIIYPVSFVYSQLDLRLRVKAYVESGELWTFYLSNIRSVEGVEGKPFDIPEESEVEMKELVFSFENVHNRAERIAARFSDYNKTVKFNQKKNTVTYTVYYPDNMTERNRIYFRLRSLGRGVDIKSGEKARVKVDAQKALANYKNGTKNGK